MKFQYCLFDGDLPGADDESGTMLLYQPTFPFPLGNGATMFFRPAFPIFFDQPDAFGPEWMFGINIAPVVENVFARFLQR